MFPEAPFLVGQHFFSNKYSADLILHPYRKYYIFLLLLFHPLFTSSIQIISILFSCTSFLASYVDNLGLCFHLTYILVLSLIRIYHPHPHSLLSSPLLNSTNQTFLPLTSLFFFPFVSASCFFHLHSSQDFLPFYNFISRFRLRVLFLTLLFPSLTATASPYPL